MTWMEWDTLAFTFIIEMELLFYKIEICESCSQMVMYVHTN
jgi:hypothetical protein